MKCANNINFGNKWRHCQKIEAANGKHEIRI